MAKQKTITEKIKSLDAYGVIMAMVRGLQNPVTKINMGTFGTVKNKGKAKVCFGCAATNAVMNIAGLTANDAIKKEDELNKNFGAHFNSCDTFGINANEKKFIENFEFAIDNLRRGDFDMYNYCVKNYNSYTSNGKRFAKIVPKPKLILPPLNNDYTKEDLKPYIELAKYQREIKKKQTKKIKS